MQRGGRRALLFLLLILPGIVGGAAFWLLPRAEVPRDEPLPDGDLIMLAQGVVRDGGARHRAGGLVTLYEERTTLARGLYFENYTARSGPNVWFFLTSVADPETRSEVLAGVELRVPGLGPAVARGSFWVPVPAEVSAGEAGAVVAWDRHIGTRFAVATLEPVSGPAARHAVAARAPLETALTHGRVRMPVVAKPQVRRGLNVISCGAVLYRMEAEPSYLLLQYTARHWDLPKGHQEPGETEEETTRREILEETGIRELTFAPDFRRTIRYSYNSKAGRVQKTVVFRLAQTETPRDAVRLSHEHVAYDWLPFAAARERLTYGNARAVLDAAHAHIMAASG